MDFDELKQQAQGLVRDHADQIKEGIDKVGEFAGEKLGKDKVEPVQQKVQAFVDSLAGQPKGTAPETPADDQAGAQQPPAQDATDGAGQPADGQ